MAYNTDVAKGQWNELKGKIKSKWAKLTDQDLQSIEGNFEELKGKLQQTYGYSKEKAQSEFDDFSSSFADKFNAKTEQAKDKLDETNRKLNS